MWEESPIPGSRLPNGDVAVGLEIFRNTRACRTCGTIIHSAYGWGQATTIALGVVAGTATGAIAYEEAPALAQALFGRAGPAPSQINSGLLNSNRWLRIGAGWKDVPRVTGYPVFRIAGWLVGGQRHRPGVGGGHASNLAAFYPLVKSGRVCATLMLEDEIYDFYRKLLSSLPEGTAVLTRHPSKDPGGEDIELVPANSNSARIYVHPMADWIYASMGQSTSMEFFVSWKKETQALESLKEFSRAVIDGKFSEDIWTLDGKIVKSAGTFVIDGRISSP